jgi:multidrug efflux pump subunit AcrA (membrane-fusion protein)
VFVIGDDGKVAQRALQATQAVGDAWIVDSGLKAGERVVVEGVQRLRAGMAVKVASAASAASAAR